MSRLWHDQGKRKKPKSTKRSLFKNDGSFTTADLKEASALLADLSE
jgi:hypothetical protein